MEHHVQRELELVQDRLLQAVGSCGRADLARLEIGLRETAVGAAACWAGGELALGWPAERSDLKEGEVRRLGQLSASLGYRAVRALLGPPGRFNVTSGAALTLVAETDVAPQVHAAMTAVVDEAFSDLSELWSWSSADRMRFRESFELGVTLALAEAALGRSPDKSVAEPVGP